MTLCSYCRTSSGVLTFCRLAEQKADYGRDEKLESLGGLHFWYALLGVVVV